MALKEENLRHTFLHENSCLVEDEFCCENTFYAIDSIVGVLTVQWIW